MAHCAECSVYGCKARDLTGVMKDCPSKNRELQEKAAALYQTEENLKIAYNAGITEKTGYCQWSRMEEIMFFAKNAGFKKLGLIFCTGLRNEAKVVSKILRANGFEVVSVICKNGMQPKASIGLTAEQTLVGCDQEVMCNPIGQAMVMNEEKVDLNLLLGLCVGHDTLCIKYLEAPVTVLAVKDRVTGHNPLAAVYASESYYKKKLYENPDLHI